MGKMKEVNDLKWKRKCVVVELSSDDDESE